MLMTGAQGKPLAPVSNFTVFFPNYGETSRTFSLHIDTGV